MTIGLGELKQREPYVRCGGEGTRAKETIPSFYTGEVALSKILNIVISIVVECVVLFV